MKNNIWKWVNNQNAALAAVCLIVLMAGGAGAWEDVHNTNGTTGTTNWNQVSGTWEKSGTILKLTGNGNPAVSGPKFIIRTHAYTKDGNYTVTLNKTQNWLNNSGAGVVFRYKSPENFYAITLAIGQEYWTSYLVFWKNPTGDQLKANSNFTSTSGYKGIQNLGSTENFLNGTYTIRIEIEGSTFKVYKGTTATLLATFNDNAADAIDSGGVGYVQVDPNSYNDVGFVSSSWTDKCTPTENHNTSYSGFYAWNTVSGPTYTAGTTGTWFGTSNTNWSTSGPCARESWPVDGNKSVVFFKAPVSGTTTVTLGGTNNSNRVRIAENMTFAASGYIIGATSVVNDSIILVSNTNITVTGENTATINARIGDRSNGSANKTLTKLGTGTLTLSGVNGYNGVTTVTDGILKVTRVAALGNAASVSIASGKTLEFAIADTTTDINFNRTISSTSGILKKSGAGKLNLTRNGNNNKAIGTLEVAAGTLAIPDVGPSTAPAVTVSNSFVLASGATLEFPLSTLGNPASLGSQTTATLNGTLDITGTLPTEDNKTYNIFSGGTATGSFSAVKVGGTLLGSEGAGINTKWYTAGGADTISITYTGGVKIVVKKKGTTGGTTTYRLTVNRAPSANGSVTVTIGGVSTSNPTAAMDVEEGTPVSVAATAANGYKFTNWTATGALPGGLTATNANGSFNMSSANVTITANFEALPTGTFTLNVEADPPAGGSAEKTETTTANRYTIKATPNDDYKFVSWTASPASAAEIADKDSPTTTVTLTGHATVTAKFEKDDTQPPVAKDVTLTVQSASTAQGTVTPATKVVKAGDLVEIEAKANEGFVFTGWTVVVGTVDITDATKANTTVKLTTNATIQATFDSSNITFKLKIDRYPDTSAGSVVVTPTQYDNNFIKSGTSLTLTATPKGLFVFKGWSGVSGDDSSATITIIMNKDMDITARFGPQDNRPELLVIDDGYYVDSSMTFQVKYHLTTDTLKSYYYAYELVRGVETVALSDRDKPVSGTKDTGTINIKVEDIRYEVDYLIYVRLVSSSGKDTLSKTADHIIAAFPFKVQKVLNVGSPVSTLSPVPDTVASVDNDRFKLDTKGWGDSRYSSNLASIALNVDVTASELKPADSLGFKTVSKGYKYAAVSSTGSASSSLYFTSSFNVSIKVETGDLPSGYGAEDVGLYRYVNGAWNVVFDTKLTADGYVTGLVWKGDTTSFNVTQDTGTYRLMINTTPPVVTILGTPYGDGGDAGRRTGFYKNWDKDSVFVRGSKITVDKGIKVNANVANTQVVVKYANAKVESSGDVLIPLCTLKVNADVAGDISINEKIIEGFTSGVLMYLMVNNGTVTDTINMSYRMKSTGWADAPPASGGYSKDKGAWSPLAVKVDLADSTIDKTFETLFPPLDTANADEDKRIQRRLVRWLPKPSGGGGGDWIDYDGEGTDKQQFHLRNGRLMWFRTRSSSFTQLNLASDAVTPSLIKTFEVRDVLKSKQWTDIMLPFDFSVRVKDILRETLGEEKTDSLFFYTWVYDSKNGSYSAQKLYVWDTDNADTAFKGPFTVYNNTGRDITLKIPPRPSFMSAASPRPVSKMAAGSGFWYYTISAATDSTPSLAPLSVGYYGSERFTPAPPTFGSQSVAILSDDGVYMGDYLTPELSKGGRTFTLRFINSDRRKAAFKFSAAASAGVPEKTQIMFIDAATGEIVGGSSSERSIAVAGGSYADVYAVVGSRDYLNKTAVGPAGAKFAVGGISVNQAARSVRIKYYVPLAGTDRVEVSVYNLKGRMVWKNAERVKQSSWNTMEWRAGQSRNRTAAGLYLIRVRAMNVSGKTTAVVNRRITFTR